MPKTTDRKFIIATDLGLSYTVTKVPHLHSTGLVSVSEHEADGRAFIWYESNHGSKAAAGLRAMCRQLDTELEAAEIEKTDVLMDNGTRSKATVFPDMKSGVAFMESVLPALKEAVRQAAAA